MNNTRILLVEDDALLKKLYSDLLSHEYLLVETASDGEQAFQKMKEGGWDLILLDVVLPKMNGFEIVRKLQIDLPLKPNKMIVFLTNLEKETDLQEAKKLGSGYLIKSELTPENFSKSVASFLQ